MGQVKPQVPAYTKTTLAALRSVRIALRAIIDHLARGKHGVANGILRKPARGEKLQPSVLRTNQLLSTMRCGIEKVFGWWKRCTGYRRVRNVGREPSRLELGFKCVCWNLKRWVNLGRA